jgi:hypothetical protein
MGRLEPGDVGLGVGALDQPEADEGVHLVDRPAHALGHVAGLGDIGVGGIVEQARLAFQAVEDAVEQGEAVGRAVQDDGLGQVDEGGGDGEEGRDGSSRCVSASRHLPRFTGEEETSSS